MSRDVAAKCGGWGGSRVFLTSSRTTPHTAAPETPGQRPAVSRCVTPNKRPPARECECHPGPVSEQLKRSVNCAEIEITSPASRVAGMVSDPRPGAHEHCFLSVPHRSFHLNLPSSTRRGHRPGPAGETQAMSSCPGLGSARLGE